MNIQVRYYTRSGNTKKVAEAIAKACAVQAKSIPEPLEGKADILFLGASEYAGNMDKEAENYINSLNKDQVNKVVIFTTSAGTKKVYPKACALLKEKEIPVDERYFYCHGKFLFMHKDQPNEEDLKAAEEFAQSIIK